MQFRWWNSFNLLAVVLLAIGIGGAVSGGRMVFDPGRIPSGKEWILYLVAGAVMLVNGFLPPVHTPEKEAVPANGATAKTKTEKEAV